MDGLPSIKKKKHTYPSGKISFYHLDLMKKFGTIWNGTVFFFIWRLCYQISVQGVHSEEIFETLPEFRNRRILTIHALLILHY